MQESLEIARAALSSLSYITSEEAQPVHINRLLGFYRKYEDDPKRLHSALEVLSELKEAVELPSGYWYPAPLRKVNIGNFLLVLSPQPTEALQRTIHSSIRMARSARITETKEYIALPEESLHSWLGVPKNLENWAEKVLSASRANLAKTIDSDRQIEIYQPNPKTKIRDDFRPKRWKTLNGEKGKASGEYFCRERTDFSQRRFFLGRFRDGMLVEEADIRADPSRLQFGIDLLNGVKNSFLWTQHSNLVQIELPKKIPPEEKKLLTAFAELDVNDQFKLTFTLDEKFFPIVESAFRKIGLIARKRM